MANNYTKFAAALKMPAEACQYAVALELALDEAANSAFEIDDLADPSAVADNPILAGLDPRLIEDAKAILDERGEWYGTSADINADGDTLSISAGECGDIEAVAEIVHAAMARLDVAEPQVIEWAHTCSAMRPGEFGGGAVVITKDGTHWMNTSTWAAEKVAELKRVRYPAYGS